MNEDVFFKSGDKETSIEAHMYLYNLQQPKTRLRYPDFTKILDKYGTSFHFVPNSTAK